MRQDKPKFQFASDRLDTFSATAAPRDVRDAIVPFEEEVQIAAESACNLTSDSGFPAACPKKGTKNQGGCGIGTSATQARLGGDTLA